MFRKLILASALVLGAAGTAHAAAACSVNLEGNDAMRYSAANIDVPKSCATFTINFKHAGKMAKNVMGHNVVVAKTADMHSIDADGIKAGAAADYVKAGDARVIAHSKVIGGGETTSLGIPVAKLVAAGAPLSFFCSFPGHSALMKGTLTLK